MARDLRAESEFGLGTMPVFTKEGDVATGTAIDAAIAAGGIPAAGNDAEAISQGADLSAADQLRMIYARGEGELGPGKVGNSEFRP